MASRSSFLPRLSLNGGNGGHILPLHRTRSKSSDDYDLDDLSPRPSSPLMSPDHDVRDFGFQDSPRFGGRSKAKAKAVAYAAAEEQFPPISVVDRTRSQRENQTVLRERERERLARADSGALRSGRGWMPPSPSHFRDGDSERGALSPRRTQESSLGGTSFMGFLNPSQSSMDRGSAGEADNTFRGLQRRERQIQKELQRLLDAQVAVLDHGDPSNDPSQGGSDTPTQASSAASSPYRARTSFHSGSLEVPAVVPVRQPKPKPLNIRQVRNSISRSMAMLADLKEEEDAYIASAVSVRKTALAKANRLSNQHKTISADLRSLEKDDPLRKELENMGDEYKKVCGDIELFEGKLRALKHQKRVLESRMEEVRSERESGLSGYRGALKETERGIGEMMRTPGVKVLSTEGVAHFDAPLPENSSDGATKDAFLGQRLNGHEFLRMRPERRTLGMAKDWWEGELALLLRRKETVDRERDALTEGAEIWAHTVQLIVGYERRLGTALSASSHLEVGPGSEAARRKTEESLFQAQYRNLRETIKEIQDRLQYAEEKGWNLLVAAIGAELEGFMESEKILSDLMFNMGYEGLREELIETGPSDGPSHGDTGKQADAGLRDMASQKQEKSQDDDDMTGSVVRRWGGDGNSTKVPSTAPSSPLPPTQYEDAEEELQHNEPPPELLSDSHHADEHTHHHKDESDNEVPPGLLSETRVDESEDEHGNEVPAEFLSMHDPLSTQSDDNDNDNDVPKDLLEHS
jgi:hypothetical protein